MHQKAKQPREANKKNSRKQVAKLKNKFPSFRVNFIKKIKELSSCK